MHTPSAPPPLPPYPPPVSAASGYGYGYGYGDAQKPFMWHSGLCGCFKDCGNCWMTLCCPCITFGRIAEILDEGHTSCVLSAAIFVLLMHVGCPCIYAYTFRTKLRKRYGLPSSPCNDLCVHWCCELCALCQEYRELRSHGIDPKLGWIGNQHRFMAPPQQQGMYR